MNDNIALMLLRKAVEEKSGLRVKTSKDFERLAEVITDSRAGYVSASTLKRLWGYVKDTRGKHTSTLDVLARFAGFPKGYNEFEQTVNRESGIESGYDKKRMLDIITLPADARVDVEWLPDRRIRLRHLGECRLEVTDSVNSKLSVGTIIRCPRIVEGEKLIVDILDADGKNQLVYEAGKKNGVVWANSAKDS